MTALDRVSPQGTLSPRAGSELALETLQLGAGGRVEVGAGECDALLFVFAGGGLLSLAGGQMLESGSAGLVLAGEQATLAAGSHGLAAVRATVGPSVDRHAPLGARTAAVATERAESGSGTGKRSFQVLFGPHNGSSRATLFVGYVPPGRAPWHYHLYDEIVWVWRGAGSFHLEAGVEPLAAGSAFRLSPRELHIVENSAAAEELAVLGVFTPAGSPSAAYLRAGAAVGAEYGMGPAA